MYLVLFTRPLAFVNKNTLPYRTFSFFWGYIFNDVQSCSIMFQGTLQQKQNTTHTPTTRQFPRCLQMSLASHIITSTMASPSTYQGGLPLPNSWDNQSIPRKVPDRHGKPYSFVCIFSTHFLLIYKLILGLKRSSFYPQKC